MITVTQQIKVNLRLNTVLLETFFNFLNDDYMQTTLIYQIEKANETSESVHASDILYNNNICHDFGVGCSLGCAYNLLSMQPNHRNHFKPSRRTRYKFFIKGTVHTMVN